MIEILEFIFQDIWHFLGIVILLGIIAEMFIEIFKAIFKK